jgi:D-alanyl-D-alanine-carboxypeptidase/D-alanyl-D-alanine-endopeptidase
MSHRGNLVALLLASAALSACGGDDSSTTQPSPAPAPTPTPSPTPTPIPTPAPNFTAIQAAIDASPVANVYVAIGTSSGTIYRYQKGGFSPTAVTPIASATKMLSGVTILRLVEAGRMSLADNPQKYLSYWTSDPADPRSRVTLQQLLSFTSGFNAEETDRGCVSDGSTTIAACAREFYDHGLQTAPGTAFSYGPAHLQIAGAMAEAATRMSFGQLFRQQVGDVAGMSSTAFTIPSGTNPRLSGGGVSTIEDYTAFLDAMRRGRLLTDVASYTADRTTGLPVLNAPDVTMTDGEWHYALTSWRECDDKPFSARCAATRLVSSPGAFGWTPWIDFDRGYWALVGMQEGVGGSVQGVALEQQLQPLINAYLGKP